MFWRSLYVPENYIHSLKALWRRALSYSSVFIGVKNWRHMPSQKTKLKLNNNSLYLNKFSFSFRFLNIIIFHFVPKVLGILTCLGNGGVDFSGSLCYQYFSRIYKNSLEIRICILFSKSNEELTYKYSPSDLFECVSGN